MKKALLNLWKFLDGKKTTIFAVSYWLLHQTYIASHIEPELLSFLIDAVQYGGGIGLLHKVHKGVKSLNKGAKSLNIV